MPEIIIIERLSKQYKQGKSVVHAIEDISLSVEAGDIFGIVGLSGAGKSTLIRALAGLVEPSSGKILFQGRDIFRMRKEELRQFRRQVGMIFQHFNLLRSRTVGKNVAYPLEIGSHEVQEERVKELLHLVGLENKKEAYPARLSGGEKQRVGIARALANHPDLLLCDEATSALDPKTTREILSLLRKINKEFGVTIVLITHEMEVIKQICNRVAVMDKGRIVETGDVTKVFADPQHPITKAFLQNSSHEIPDDFFKKLSANRKLLRLSFKGDVAGEPIISEIVRRFNVNANILLGWIDRLQSLTVGTLVIELTGEPEGIREALGYLQKKGVHYEEMKNEL